MTPGVESTHSLAGRLAEDLLKAWFTGNAVELRAELERSISVSEEAYNTAEQERRHLLQAVAQRMRACPDLFEPQCHRPELDLYARLLGNIIPPESQRERRLRAARISQQN